MSDQRDGGISWTDETWNPIRGCSRVSAGCDNCYAMSVAYRFKGAGQPYEGLATLRKGKPDWVGVTAEVPSHLGDPLRWRRPRRIFVNSMSDLFHPSVSNEYIAAVFGVMAASPQHTFQVLTKRPARAAEWFAWIKAQEHPDGGPGPATVCGVFAANNGADVDYLGLRDRWPLSNVWLGVSTEDQKTADERIPLLLRLPAAVRFISAEPLLGPLDLRKYLNVGGICECDPSDPQSDRCEGKGRNGWIRCNAGGRRLNWVIVGGESGNAARPFDLGWARQIAKDCAAQLGMGTNPWPVPCFIKQMGADPIDGLAGCSVHFASKKGGDINEWPTELRVQQFPTVSRV
jgi:protein gp37